MIEPERLEYDLTADSLVWDVGAYRGDFACEIVKRYACRVWCFEPMLVYVDAIRRRLGMLTDRAMMFPFGLLDEDRKEIIALAGDRTSLYPQASEDALYEGGVKMPATFCDVSAFLADRPIERVDLTKVNIEGGEFPLLRRLVDTGDVKKFGYLQIQFHPFYPKAYELYEQIAADLNRTHVLSWRRPWIWESWKRRD